MYDTLKRGVGYVPSTALHLCESKIRMGVKISRPTWVVHEYKTPGHSERLHFYRALSTHATFMTQKIAIVLVFDLVLLFHVTHPQARPTPVGEHGASHFIPDRDEHVS